jgi:hypothetical protein
MLAILDVLAIRAVLSQPPISCGKSSSPFRHLSLGLTGAPFWLSAESGFIPFGRGFFRTFVRHRRCLSAFLTPDILGGRLVHRLVVS